jgi:hypothetical protein
LSAYTDFIAKEVSNKIVLFEVDVGRLQTGWYSEEAGIWARTFTTWVTTSYDFGSGAFGYGSFGGSGTGTIGNTDQIFNINSLSVDGDQYALQNSLVNVRATDSSFYFDSTTSILYIHFEDWKQYWEFSGITVGFTSSFANKGCYYDDFYYESRLKNLPALSQQKDFLFFGLSVFGGGTITLRNEDGALDELPNEEAIFGQPVRIKFGGDDLAYSDFATVYTGFVDGITGGFTETAIETRNELKYLEKAIADRQLDTTTWPDISANNANAPIQYVYGNCRAVEVICLNEDEAPAPSDYSFVLADETFHDITSISNIKVNGVSKTASTGLTHDATNDIAYFELAAADYTPGDLVIVDIVGYDDSGLIEDALDVIKDIIVNTLQKPYNATNFNTTQWAAESANDLDVGIVIIDQTAEQAISEVSNSNYGNFILQADGKFSYKVYDSTDSAAATITQNEILEYNSATWPTDEYLTSFSVKYDRGWNTNGKFRRIREDSNESDIFTRYGKYRYRVFETLLTDATDAQTYADRITELTERIVPTYVFTTITKYIDLQITDLIDVEINRVSKTMYGTVRMQIVNITKDFTNNTVQIAARFVSNQ